MSIEGPISVNYHLYKPCNYQCQFCFATFADIEGSLDLGSQHRLLCRLREAGCEKINFAGGEPTLYRGLGELLHAARDLGFVTAIITNGARLAPLLNSHSHDLDWVGLSVDSADEEVQASLGRGHQPPARPRRPRRRHQAQAKHRHQFGAVEVGAVGEAAFAAVEVLCVGIITPGDCLWRQRGNGAPCAEARIRSKLRANSVSFVLTLQPL